VKIISWTCYFFFGNSNPIEQRGTILYLRARQLDVLFAIKLEYPSFAEEVQVVNGPLQMK
jgi:MoxR-like ATPase